MLSAPSPRTLPHIIQDSLPLPLSVLRVFAIIAHPCDNVPIIMPLSTRRCRRSSSRESAAFSQLVLRTLPRLSRRFAAHPYRKLSPASCAANVCSWSVASRRYDCPNKAIRTVPFLSLVPALSVCHPRFCHASPSAFRIDIARIRIFDPLVARFILPTLASFAPWPPLPFRGAAVSSSSLFLSLFSLSSHVGIIYVLSAWNTGTI